MTGGIVTDTRIVSKTIEIDIVEDRGKDRHCIITPLSAAARCIEEGDSVFFNEKNLFWSPRSRCWRDYRLDKIGEKELPKSKPAPEFVSKGANSKKEDE